MNYAQIESVAHCSKYVALEKFEVLERVYNRNEGNAGLMGTTSNIFKSNV